MRFSGKLKVSSVFFSALAGFLVVLFLLIGASSQSWATMCPI